MQANFCVALCSTCTLCTKVEKVLVIFGSACTFLFWQESIISLTLFAKLAVGFPVVKISFSSQAKFSCFFFEFHLTNFNGVKLI